MPYYKPHKTPVESFDESLEDIERQASLLFEEFVRLETPVHSAGYALRAKAEHSDSPVVHGRQFGGELLYLQSLHCLVKYSGKAN